MDNDNEFNYSSDNNFKQVPKKNNGFGKTVFVPFLSGIVGTALVLGVCFGVPNIKNKLIGSNSSVNTDGNSSNSASNSEYNAKLMDIAEFSETSVAVAEKVLPSVVGINVEYSIASSFGQTGVAEAAGSGVIISKDGYIITNNHVINASSSSTF